VSSNEKAVIPTDNAGTDAGPRCSVFVMIVSLLATLTLALGGGAAAKTPDSSRRDSPEGAFPEGAFPEGVFPEGGFPEGGRSVTPAYFYGNFFGHEVGDLETVWTTVVQAAERGTDPRRGPVVFLLGDSTLDNKAWVKEYAPALNGYEAVLDPPMMREDVGYHLNRRLADTPWVAINCAVEASLLATSLDYLSAHDLFVTRHISDRDAVVVSIGANDIAMSRTGIMGTILVNMLRQYTAHQIRTYPEVHQAMASLVSHYRDGVQEYTKRVLNGTRPMKVVICMVYYPDMSATEFSWAADVLDDMDYDADPTRLQALIDVLFLLATSNIHIPGVEVVPFPMATVLDGKNTSDYAHRVEPSSQGGAKLAAALAAIITAPPVPPPVHTDEL